MHNSIAGRNNPACFSLFFFKSHFATPSPMKSAISCIILFLSIFSSEVYAQSIHVTDDQSNSLKGVQLLKPGGGFLISDNQGRINTSTIKNGQIIILKSLGYFTDTLTYSTDLKLHVLKKKDYDLDEVVITGQYRPVKKSQSVYAIKTISAKEIEDRAAINLRDVLQNELNFRVSRDNILGSGLSMQGLSGQNVKIMIDGVPVIGGKLWYQCPCGNH
jgi:outer membrane receptor for ferrienterochelin and colicins